MFTPRDIAVTLRLTMSLPSQNINLFLSPTCAHATEDSN